jgi:hypothetical protein
MKRDWLILPGLVAHESVMAARPLVTDDARLTNAGKCQRKLELPLPQSTEFRALPACNQFGNSEVSLGTGVAYDSQGLRSQDYVIQGKTLIRKLNTDDWGWGVAFGHVMYPAINPCPILMGNAYGYIPI